ncbi:cytidine and deoxycytidylate deaminase domain-containing protein [Hirsutella rhossiliensis]|uniref:Cytidine and deoxycytidylate deaminase domain-containing protein n=1 Tax=Hirsutella rhossiliensis TaxID=111463 RepID=A0A9P8SG30_9HYPO|nr:cytidine and deoxycytidylate deaminase domain-containing protein [Hirsutella rhossiliensis]KAH0961533.1 cytidine and deoxycytidylate deaminase domain-containing protein [Hirsutella rhossiliensis]
MAPPPESPSALLSAILKLIQGTIVPLTREGVASGSKVFGAAVLARSDLRPLSVATNNERLSPLLHGEVNCIQRFFTVDFPDPAARPDPRRDCLFFATHEPCSLCLSAIAWAGFGEFYYLFTHDDSRSLFSIPHDIDILHEVFCVRAGETDGRLEGRPLYNRSNKFFEGHSLADIVVGIDDQAERQGWLNEIQHVKNMYSSLNQTYQEVKSAGMETSSVWK